MEKAIAILGKIFMSFCNNLAIVVAALVILALVILLGIMLTNDVTVLSNTLQANKVMGAIVFSCERYNLEPNTLQCLVRLPHLDQQPSSPQSSNNPQVNPPKHLPPPKDLKLKI